MLGSHRGQEIYLFFYRFGVNGIYGIILCNFIMSYIIYKTLKIILKNDITTYKGFLNIIIPISKRKYLNLNFILNIIINIFLLGTFFIMISGFGAYFNQEFGIAKIIGSTILASICYFVFLGNIEKIAKINSVVIPILILIVTIVGVKNLLEIDIAQIGYNTKVNTSLFWVIQSIVYSSYNSLLLIPVLISIRKFVKNNKQILFISIITGIIISIISSLIFFLLINVKIDFKNLEMPIVYVIANKFNKISRIYVATILIAIFTTAISIGISFLNNICKNNRNFPQIAIIMCITSIVICNIGFSNLVKTLFPMFGYLGLIQIYFIIKYYKNLK